MKKIFLIAVALILAAALPCACADSIPGESTEFYAEGMDGFITEVLPLEDGMLVVGASEYGDEGWMASLRTDGSARWVLPEEDGGSFRCAGVWKDGYCALIKRIGTYDDLGNKTNQEETLLAFISSEGVITETLPLDPYTEWLLPYGDGFYLIGNIEEDPDSPVGGQAPKAAIKYLNGAGETQWSFLYTNPAYIDMTFFKGVIAGDSLVVIGSGLAEDGAQVGIIHRIDLDGEVIWNAESRDREDAFMSDVAVSSGGLIAGCYTGVSFDTEMGYPVDRSGFVFCMTLDGEVLWEYALADSLSCDYIVPMANGFLIGSRGLDLESCPNLGDGWLLYLDEKGNAGNADALPSIGGGILELMGIMSAGDGEALLFGATLEEPGFPGVPFVTRVSIP